MQFPPVPLVNVVKTVVAVAALSALAGVAGSQLAPNVPLGKLLLLCAISAALLCGFILLIALTGSAWNQIILRKGGTDPQWFWFDAGPPGMTKAREDIASQVHSRTQ